MIFVSIDDFYEKTSFCNTLTRQEELECAKRMRKGDFTARDKIIQSYMPMVASHIKHSKANLQNLGLVIYCQQALENAIDSFDFLQDSEPFSHRLSWVLRQATVNYIAK